MDDYITLFVLYMWTAFVAYLTFRMTPEHARYKHGGLFGCLIPIYLLLGRWLPENRKYDIYWDRHSHFHPINHFIPVFNIYLLVRMCFILLGRILYSINTFIKSVGHNEKSALNKWYFNK